MSVPPGGGTQTTFFATVLQGMCATLMPATAFGSTAPLPSVDPNIAFDYFTKSIRDMDGKKDACPIELRCIVCNEARSGHLQKKCQQLISSLGVR